MLRRVSQNFAAQGFGFALLFADRFLVVAILLRAWGAQLYSEWVILFSAAGMLSLGELGLNVYFGNLLQRLHTTAQTEAFFRTVRVSLFCSLALGTFLAASGAALVVSSDLHGTLSIIALSRAETAAILVLLGLASASRVARGVISQIYRGRQEFARGILVEQVFSATFILLAIFAALAGVSPMAMAAIYLGCDLAAGWILMTIDLSKRLPHIVLRPLVPSLAELTEVWRQLRWLAVLNLASNGWVQVPVILLGYFGVTGSALVTLLVLRTLANMGRQLATMLALSSAVEIVAVHYAGRRDDVSRQLGAVGRGLSSMTAAMAVAIGLYGEQLVTLWTGQGDLFNAHMAMMLFGSSMVSAPSLPLVAFGLYANSSRAVALVQLSQLVIGLLACVLLIPHFGALGAAAGLVLAEVVAQGVILPVVGVRNVGINYRGYMLECIGAMALSLVWCAGVGIGLALVFDTASWVQLGLSAGVWALLGVCPAFWVTLTPGQRSAIARTLSRWLASYGRR